MTIVVHEDSAEGSLEQRTHTAVRAVESPRVRVEKIRERLGETGGKVASIQILLDPHQKMEMVSHQAIRIGVRDGKDMEPVKPEEILVVSVFKKKVFPVIAAIENMENSAWN